MSAWLDVDGNGGPCEGMRGHELGKSDGRWVGTGQTPCPSVAAQIGAGGQGRLGEICR